MVFLTELYHWCNGYRTSYHRLVDRGLINGVKLSKDWLAQNQCNLSQWSDMFTPGWLFQWASTVKVRLSVLAQYIADSIIIISFNVTCSRRVIAQKCSWSKYSLTHCFLAVAFACHNLLHLTIRRKSKD